MSRPGTEQDLLLPPPPPSVDVGLLIPPPVASDNLMPPPPASLMPPGRRRRRKKNRPVFSLALLFLFPVFSDTFLIAARTDPPPAPTLVQYPCLIGMVEESPFFYYLDPITLEIRWKIPYVDKAIKGYSVQRFDSHRFIVNEHASVPCLVSLYDSDKMLSSLESSRTGFFDGHVSRRNWYSCGTLAPIPAGSSVFDQAIFAVAKRRFSVALWSESSLDTPLLTVPGYTGDNVESVLFYDLHYSQTSPVHRNDLFVAGCIRDQGIVRQHDLSRDGIRKQTFMGGSHTIKVCTGLGKRLFTFDQNYSIRIFSMNTSNSLQSIRFKTSYCSLMHFVPDLNLLVVGETWDGSVTLYDVRKLGSGDDGKGRVPHLLSLQVIDIKNPRAFVRVTGDSFIIAGSPTTRFRFRDGKALATMRDVCLRFDEEGRDLDYCPIVPTGSKTTLDLMKRLEQQKRETVKMHGCCLLGTEDLIDEIESREEKLLEEQRISFCYDCAEWVGMIGWNCLRFDSVGGEGEVFLFGGLLIQR